MSYRSPAHHAVSIARRARDAYLDDVVREATRQIRFLDFKHLSADRFRLLSDLVFMDRLADLSEEEIAAEIEVRPVELVGFRNDASYVEMRRKFDNILDAMSQPKKLLELLEDDHLQQDLALKLVRNALNSRDPRESNKALEAIHDRVAPIETKDKDPKLLVISEDLAKVLTTALYEEKVIGQGRLKSDGEPDEV